MADTQAGQSNLELQTEKSTRGGSGALPATSLQASLAVTEKHFFSSCTFC